MIAIRKWSFSCRVLLCLLAVIVVLASIHLLFQYLNLNTYHELNGPIYEISNRVDFDDEASLPTWVSQVIWLAVGLSAFVVALVQRAASAKRLWGLIGIVGVLLSADEVAAIHELGLQTIHLALFKQAPPTLTDNAWLILLPFILVIGSLLLWQLIKYTPRKTVIVLSAGAFVLMFGAVIVDILTTSSNANTFQEKGVMVAVEETFELVGASTILYGILDYLETSYSNRIKKALNHLKG